ncbi:hypothetical protein GALMADRAFT_259434 [Galerina marginata CBS 339.88]|uniref:Uncharacterized protein n=1 Tax=Galerina marginata (strain CBS 339.88) TaxID=685588 RepID=A0A067S688_GALM3|nr:hypothetical protein GALMADRAFT_259434 [Galerina marginata CBS 339.88]
MTAPSDRHCARRRSLLCAAGVRFGGSSLSVPWFVRANGGAAGDRTSAVSWLSC